MCVDMLIFFTYMLHIYNSFVSGTCRDYFGQRGFLSILTKVTCKTDWDDLARGKLFWIVKDFGIFQAFIFPENPSTSSEMRIGRIIKSIAFFRWDGFLVRPNWCQMFWFQGILFHIRCCQASKRWTCLRKTVECHSVRGTCDIGVAPFRCSSFHDGSCWCNSRSSGRSRKAVF